MPSIDDYNQLATSFTIIERTGDKRAIALRGRALPYRPFSLSGTQRNSIEWYPGNPIGVLQVYGAKEEETTIQGYWKDIFLGEGGHPPYAQLNGAGVLTAIDLAALVDDMRRKGQEIVVTWLNHTRYGIIDRFTQKWHTGHDVEWEISFLWIAQEDISLNIDVPFSTNNPAADLISLPNEAQNLVDNITTPSQRLKEASVTDGGAINDFATGFDSQYQDLVDQIDAGLYSIQSKVNELNDAVVTIATIVTAPADAQRRIAGVLDGLKLSASDNFELLEESADGARLNIGGPFGLVLADRAAARDQANTTFQIQALAAAQESKILDAIVSDVLAVFTARAGDDLRYVSLTYYGTADNWQALMMYNSLDTETLVAGQVIVVPQALPGATV